MIQLDKETVALIIAQNGLLTAATLVAANAAKLERRKAKSQDVVEIAALTRQIRKAEKLAAALRAANDAIAQYQAETAE